MGHSRAQEHPTSSAPLKLLLLFTDDPKATRPPLTQDHLNGVHDG